MGMNAKGFTGTAKEAARSSEEGGGLQSRLLSALMESLAAVSKKRMAPKIGIRREVSLAGLTAYAV